MTQSLPIFIHKTHRPKKFSKPKELITSVIAKTEIVSELVCCPTTVQLVNWTTIWGHSGKELPRDTACCLSKLTPQGLTAKYWHKSISSKYAPVIDFAAGLTTYHLQVSFFFLKILNHQSPRVLSHLASSFLAAAVAESIEMHFSCYCPLDDPTQHLYAQKSLVFLHWHISRRKIRSLGH